MALISAILVMTLMSAMLVGFLALISGDQVSGAYAQDQTQAYAAAQGGVEKLTADLGRLFNSNFSPTIAQVNALVASGNEPALAGVRYLRPNGTSGYRIIMRDSDPADGNPDVDNPLGTAITSGPFEGLQGLITRYVAEVTARTRTNAEVMVRREMQTVAIPVFQFGMFSENNLSYFAGPNFAFGGRVHTNQNLFLKQGDGTTLTLRDHVSAVGEVVRTHLQNGVTGSNHNGTVRLARAAGCPAAPAAATASCYNLAANQGSLDNTMPGPSQVLNPTWTSISVGTSNGWLKNGRTGARRLELPIASDGAEPIDIIKRPPAGESTTGNIGRQRYYNMATLRILLSDRPTDLTSVPGAVGTPIRLLGARPVDGVGSGPQPFAASGGDIATPPYVTDMPADYNLVNDGYRTAANGTTIDGWLLVNRQSRAGTWTDVTADVLNQGFTGRRLSDGAWDAVDMTGSCVTAPNPGGAVHPNAIIRVQRPKDNAPCQPSLATTMLVSGTLQPKPNPAYQFIPNVLYDPREGKLRDTTSSADRAPNPSGHAYVAANQPRVYLGGVMHYVELDVDNLRRWLRGDIGSTAGNAVSCANGGGGSSCPMDVTGFVVYFSDRRTNRTLGSDLTPDDDDWDPSVGPLYTDDAETGELGFEDNINTTSTGVANGVLDHQYVDAQGVTRWSEDVNQNGTLETYGSVGRLAPATAGIDAPLSVTALINGLRGLSGGATSLVGCSTEPCARSVITPAITSPTATGTTLQWNLYTTPVDRRVARVNRAFFFRRALKLVNGGLGNLPANGAQGLTVASENPVYIQGNYNACNDVIVPRDTNAWGTTCDGGGGFVDAGGATHVSAAVIADAVTLLSNAWNDIRSFRNPISSGTSLVSNPDARHAVTTWYRVGIIAGKQNSFSQSAAGGGPADFGTDGGAHNFLRYIEKWDGDPDGSGPLTSPVFNYRGSLLSFFTSRQAVGTFKCCNIVYAAPQRAFIFEDEFLTPSLLPPRTPLFRDINATNFRQILRPTQ